MGVRVGFAAGTSGREEFCGLNPRVVVVVAAAAAWW